MIRCQKWVNGQMARHVLSRVIDTPEHRTDGREFLTALKAICRKNMEDAEIERWRIGEFATRDNPAFGQLGLVALDEAGEEICTYWWSGNSPDDKTALRKASDASGCAVGLPGDPPPQRYPERNGRWGGVHKFQEPTYLRDLVTDQCAAQLTLAKELLVHFRNITDIARVPVPGSMEEKWREIFTDG